MKPTNRESAQVHLSEISILEKQKAFQELIFEPTRIFDSIDEECEIDPLLLDRPVQRRTGKETSRLLGILDELDWRDG